MLKRLARGVLVLFLVSLAVFAMSILAGDPIALMLPADAPAREVQRLRAVHGLDDPVPVRFARFLAGLGQGDLGRSLRFGEPALALVLERLGASLQLGGAALAVTIVVAVPTGIVSAVRRSSALDALVVTGSVLGHSVPSFFLGLLLIYCFAVSLRLLPTSGHGTVAHLVMPALTLGLFYAGRLTRVVRSSLLDVLDQDYLQTARAKGLAEPVVVLRHALRNAALPVVTVLGLEVGAILAGAVATETVFAWPGIGRLAVESASARDYPVVQAVVLVVAASFVLSNLAVDLICRRLDPRVELG